MRAVFYFPARTYRVALLLLMLLTGASAVRAQAPAWQTAVPAGRTDFGAALTNGYSVSASAADGNGNIYLAGAFAGAATFGNVTLTSSGSSTSTDLFVAKWSRTTGNFVWAQRASAASGQPGGQVAALAVSGANVYLAGSFSGTLNFGGVALTSGTASTDVFVAKLTDAGTSGSFGWARRTAGNGYSLNAAALAANGSNVYLTGGFTGTASFGTAAVTSATTTGQDVYVAKLSDTGAGGSFAWAQRAGGSNDDYPAAIAVNGTNVYVSGVFYSTTATFGTTSLANAGGNDRDVFVAQLTDAGPTGSFGPAQRAGGVGRDRTFANELVATANAVYLVGDFSTNVPLTFGSTSLPPTANGTILARWNPVSGAFDWAQPAPGAYPNYAYYSTLAASGTSVYVGGGFRGTVAVGGTTLTSLGAGGNGDNDALVAKLTDNGSSASVGWVQTAAGTSDDGVGAIFLSGTTVYTLGTTRSASVAFGSLTLTNAYYSSSSSAATGGFLASLTDATLTATRPAGTEAALALYPNPAYGITTVRLPGGPAHTLTLADALGREVRRYPVPTGAAETALDLRGLPPGLYLLRGEADSQRLVLE